MENDTILNEKELVRSPLSTSPENSGEKKLSTNILDYDSSAVNDESDTLPTVNSSQQPTFTPFDLSMSSAVHDEKNRSFPLIKTITSIEDLGSIAEYDHIAGKYGDGKNNRGTPIKGYKSHKTHLGANVVVLSLTNEQPDPTQPDLTPDQYITPDKIAERFENVEFNVVFHDQQMGLSPRPKFNVYFPLRDYQSVDDAESVIKNILAITPEFEVDTDATRVIFGIDCPVVEHYEGTQTIDEYLINQNMLANTYSHENVKTNKDPVTTDDINDALIQLGIEVKYDVLSGMVRINNMPKQYSLENAPNVLPVVISDYLKEQGRKVSRQTIDDGLIVVMDENRVNPVIEMLAHTKRDGHDYLHDITEILGLQDKDFEQLLLKKWLHQTVAMVHNSYDVPYGADGVLVLQGDQGAGKTYFFNKLALYPDWFAEGVSIDLSNKDTIIQSTSVWIAELGELDSTLKREQSSLKAFLTSRRDTYRVPYGRTAIRRPRRTSFCGTVNPGEFLNDETGSRRFWVVHVDHIDLDRLKALSDDNIRQLWRQVYEDFYLPNPQGFRLSSDEREQLEKRNQQYAKPLAGEIEIRDHLHMNHWNWGYYTVSEVMRELNLHGLSSSQVGKALNKIAREYPDKINVKSAHNVKRYYLPLLY